MIKDSKRKDEESVSNEIDKCSNSTQLSKQTIKKNQAKTAGSHFVIAERICGKLGFDIHLRQGQQILKRFVMYCFPKGIEKLDTKSKVKKMSLENLVPILESIEKTFPDKFNSNTFANFASAANFNF
jgi:hypothetical protein